MDDVVSTITDYYDSTGERTVETGYLSWSPGSYRYVFRPTRPPIRFLADRIRGPDRYRRLAALLLRGGAIGPRLLRIVPGISSYTIPVPPSSSFDLAIAGYRVKLLSFEDRTVTTLPLDEIDLSDEVAIRRSLPDTIRVPQILSYDETTPAYTERLVQGREIANPIADWKSVLDALQQLIDLYHTEPIEHIATENAIAEVDDRLTTLGLEQNSVIKTGRDTLDQLSLPPYLAKGTIHGDFHTGNLLSTDGDVYILDWENTRQGYLIADFFKPFTSYYFDTGKVEPVLDMVLGESKGAEIARTYGNHLGTLAYGTASFPHGLPIFHLLDRIAARESRDAAVSSLHYGLLEILVDGSYLTK